MKHTSLKHALLGLMACLPCQLNASESIKNDTDWKDTSGNPISCHDGGITRAGEIFYWYGTSYKGNPKGKFGKGAHGLLKGFNVYSSKDLSNWTFQGVCLDFSVEGNSIRGTAHRPSVIYNDKTKKYVMWFFDFAEEYPDVMMTVAVSQFPTGPFKILGLRKTGEEHGWAQDCGLFKDDDGKAYLVYDDGHRNIRVDLLSDDYLSSTKKNAIALKPTCEGSAMIKYRGKYIVAGSGVRGWSATETVYAVASSPLGPYSEKRVMSEKKTWRSQISNFLYIKETDTVMAICDQWWAGPKGYGDLEESRQLWIPVSFDPATDEAKMIHKEQWTPLPYQGRKDK